MYDQIVEDARLEQSNSPLFNIHRIRSLYVRDTSRGASNRRLLKATLPIGTYTAFKNFLETTAGGGISRGNGIASPMVSVALNFFMAAITGHFAEDSANELSLIINENDRERVKEYIRELAELV